MGADGFLGDKNLIMILFLVLYAIMKMKKRIMEEPF